MRPLRLARLESRSVCSTDALEDKRSNHEVMSHWDSSIADCEHQSHHLERTLLKKANQSYNFLAMRVHNVRPRAAIDSVVAATMADARARAI